MTKRECEKIEARQEIGRAVGENIRERLQAAGITAGEAADVLEITPQTMSNYLTGKTGMPVPVLVELAELVGVAPSKLLVGV